MNIHMSKYRGFTLIELVITTAVIGLLAMAAGPNLGTFLTRNKLTTQTNYLVSSLNLARSEAAKRGTTVLVCISNAAQTQCITTGTWESGWLSFVDTNNDGNVDTGETILNVNNEVSGTTTIRSAQHINLIAYRGDGSTTSGTFVICDAEGVNRAKAINIMGSGLISQGKKNGDNIVDDYTGVNIVCP